jgi:hypothetical protein
MDLTPLAKFANDTLVGMMCEGVVTNVISAMAQLRARVFFESFLKALRLNPPGQPGGEETLRKLDDLIQGSYGRDIIYEACRRVSLCRSKLFGPRIIGVLAGKLLLEAREADEVEESIYAVATELSDEDMLSFLAQYEVWKGEHFKEGRSAALTVPFDEHSIGVGRAGSIDFSSINFREHFGNWGRVLSSHGFIESLSSMRRVPYQEDSDRHIDEDGIDDIYATSIYCSESCAALADLIRQVRD